MLFLMTFASKPLQGLVILVILNFRESIRTLYNNNNKKKRKRKRKRKKKEPYGYRSPTSALLIALLPYSEGSLATKDACEIRYVRITCGPLRRASLRGLCRACLRGALS